MSSIHIDLVEGNLARETAEYGKEFDRIAIIEGLTGDADAKIYNAFSDLDSGGYTMGAAHPELSSAKIRERIVESIDKDKVRVRLVYRQYAGGYGQTQTDTEEVGATVQQQETNLDKNGNVIHIAHNDTDYGKTTTKYVPKVTFQVTKEEGTSPIATAASYVGKINSNNGWQVSGDQYKWLCTGIIGRSNDGGSTYLVTYSFEYDPDNWRQTLFHPDEITGEIDPESTDGDGFETWDVYDTANFGALGL